ncbi:hypothetical protein [Streptomyces sp. NPDC048481]|uniref:hypothetical protein n=1 Tax=Streptomyces sp. NPDC048481 TaxID=3365557 RepID=UPI00370FDE5C
MGAGTRKSIPWLVLALWAGVLALASPFAAKPADVQHDRVTDCLPACPALRLPPPPYGSVRWYVLSVSES